MFLAWIILAVLIVGLLALDLGVFHRRARVIELREAVYWTIFWIALALAFNAGVYVFLGKEKALLFLTGYLIEKALSVDNLFVLLIIFSYFAVPGNLQHKVLFWGIVGAIITRGVFIALGVTLINHFFWLTYVLGLFLIFTGIKAAFEKGDRLEPEKNPVIVFLRKNLPVANYFDGEKFFTVHEGKRYVTPLFVALLVIEATDVVFALDSVPAILAITTDPFIVFSSNLFAILGLRALFFAFAALVGLFRFLQIGVSLILVIVGLKMLLVDFVHIPEFLMLATVLGVIVLSIAASLLIKPKPIPEVEQ